MPVGVNAVPDLIATAEASSCIIKSENFEKQSHIYYGFPDNGEYVKGCIAGGRYYLHINANGDIDMRFYPLFRFQYSWKNLVGSLPLPLFMAYRNSQPFNQNHLCPCPLLDNPVRWQKSWVCECNIHGFAKSEDVEFYRPSALRQPSGGRSRIVCGHAAVTAKAESDRKFLCRMYSWKSWVCVAQFFYCWHEYRLFIDY